MGIKIVFKKQLDIKLGEIKSILKNNFLKKINILYRIPSSSDNFSFSNARIIENMLIPIIFISYSFYVLKSANEKLNNEIKNDLKLLLKLTYQQISKDDPNDNELKFISYLNQKLNLEMEKQVFQKQPFVQFDSISEHHHGALGKVQNYNITKNIIIKIKGSGTEKTYIRIGLVIKKENEIFLMDIVNKKNSPKRKK